MEETQPGIEVVWMEQAEDKRLKESKKLLVAELLLMVPLAVLGLIIAAYPVSFPLLYYIVMKILE
ncbi:MAG TPA: hypothetical protein VLD40_05660 [Dissulfurispiraceae bacterium]|nr:hypothetical protein [Dissulfurispiraceae bacterium]